MCSYQHSGVKLLAGFGPNPGLMAPEKDAPETKQTQANFCNKQSSTFLLQSSIQCLYSQTIALVSAVTAQLFLHVCLPTLAPDCSECTSIYTDKGF